MIQLSIPPTNRACNTLEINKSSYYDWQKRLPDYDCDDKLKEDIREITLEFPGYGYRRVTATLHRKKQLVNRKKVLRLMREEHLLCKRKKCKPQTTNSRHCFTLYPNLVKSLEVQHLNHVWVSDITYVHINEGYVYLAAIVDLFSRKCVGWDMSRNIDTELTLNALNMALNNRQILGFDNLIHHSDRGVQYASKEYVKKLTEYGIQISMSETGNPRENAFAESFIKTLKAEEVYIKEYATFSEALANIKQFIEEVYNAKRLHSSIGYVPPDEFEKEVLNIRYLTVQN